MNIPNNQVLRQISDFDCECGDDFKQPFEQTDIPKLWVELPILGSNIVNGTFASSSGWTVGAKSSYRDWESYLYVRGFKCFNERHRYYISSGVLFS